MAMKAISLERPAATPLRVSHGPCWFPLEMVGAPTWGCTCAHILDCLQSLPLVKALSKAVCRPQRRPSMSGPKKAFCEAAVSARYSRVSQ